VQFFRRRSSALAILLFAVLAFAGCGGHASHPDDGAKKPATRPTIVFMTDFGTANDAVAICKAVMIGIAPDARIMDITHQVTPFQIGEASRLAGAEIVEPVHLRAIVKPHHRVDAIADPDEVAKLTAIRIFRIMGTE